MGRKWGRLLATGGKDSDKPQECDDVAAAETSALFGPQLPVMNTSNTQPADAEETRTTLAEDKEHGIKEDIIPII